MSIAGDQLVKRLLERIIVPKFAGAIGLEEEDVQLLFGPRVPKNRGFTSQRIDWVNRMFVPLAEAYLQAAVDEVAQNEPDREAFEISHTDPELVDPAVLESLEQVCNKLRGPGYYDLNQDLGLTFEKAAFEDVVHEVFDDLLFDFCTRIAEYQADVVLLAGQPSKLGYLQQLVQKYLPLPPSRIIPMFNHYAGNWYPYQDPEGQQAGLDRRSQERGGGRRGHRVHGPQRHAGPVQVRDAGQGQGEHVLLGRDDRIHLHHPRGTRPVPSRSRTRTPRTNGPSSRPSPCGP